MQRQTSYEDQKTVCPFYLSDNPYHTQSILCEGIVEDCRNLSVFGDKKAKLNHKENFCNCNNYKNCPIHEKLMEKY